MPSASSPDVLGKLQQPLLSKALICFTKLDACKETTLAQLAAVAILAGALQLHSLRQYAADRPHCHGLAHVLSTSDLSSAGCGHHGTHLPAAGRGLGDLFPAA